MKPPSSKLKKGRYAKLLSNLTTEEWRPRPKDVPPATMIAARNHGFVEVRYGILRDEIKLTSAGQIFLRQGSDYALYDKDDAN